MLKNTVTIIFTLFLLSLSQAALAQPTLTGATCISPDPSAAATVYTVNNPIGNTINGMGQLGDIEITTALPPFPFAGASFTFSARSLNRGREITNTCNDYLKPANNLPGVDATNYGFAKGRLTIFYNTNTYCDKLVDLDIFKSFTLHPPIVGPRCIKVNDTVTYSVCNIISGRTADMIGQDQYYWAKDNQLNYTKPNNFPAGFKFLYSSADGSSITFLVEDNYTANQTLYCRFGQCASNINTVSSLQLGTTTPKPYITLKNSNQSITYTPPYCIASTETNIVLAVAPSVLGIYNYYLSSNNYSWSFASGGSYVPTLNLLNTNGNISLNVIIGQSGGELYVKTSGGCDTRTDVVQIGRGLTPPFTITGNTSLGGPNGNCIGAGGGIFTLNGQPGNVPISWTLPSGWMITGPQNGTTITAIPGVGAVSGQIITALVFNCTSTGVNLPVYVRPATPGAISLSIGGQSVSGPPFCIPKPAPALSFTTAGTANISSYVWSVPAGWLPTPANPSPATITITPNNTTSGPVTVFATSGGGCLSPNSANAVVNYAQATPVIAPPATCPGNLRGFDANTLSILGSSVSNLRQTTSFSVQTPVTTPATTYTWSFDPGLVFGTASAPGTGSTVTFTCAGVPGTYRIWVTATATGVTTCGSTISQPYTVLVDLMGNTLTLDPSPAPPQTAIAEIYTLTSPPFGASYFWYELPANLTIGGSISPNANTMYNNVLISSGSKNFGVIVTYTGGCTNAFTQTTTSFSHNRSGHQQKKKDAGKKTQTGKSETITLQPNPAHSSTTLILPVGKINVSVSVVNVEGRLLWKRSMVSSTNTTINTANWPSGEYTVIVREPNGKTVTKKLIVQKQ